MPSIEIVSVGQTQLPELPQLPFAVLCEKELRSHRDPSLFQSDFDALTGVIYHLGCLHLIESDRGCFEAYELLNTETWDDERGLLRFKIDIVADIRAFLSLLIDWSPTRQIVFTTDYQFAPKNGERSSPLSEDRFWQLHDADELRMNALYKVFR